LLSIDPAIIYGSILSSTDEEVSSAAKPSATLMLPSRDELTSHFRAISSIVNTYRTSKSALQEGERLFGDFKNIVVTFGKLKVIVILNDPEHVMLALATLKDADEKKITFQSSRIMPTTKN
jgi:hypothetical protein